MLSTPNYQQRPEDWPRGVSILRRHTGRAGTSNPYWLSACCSDLSSMKMAAGCSAETFLKLPQTRRHQFPERSSVRVYNTGRWTRSQEPCRSDRSAGLSEAFRMRSALFRKTVERVVSGAVDGRTARRQ
jgi:hypothetical protein